MKAFKLLISSILRVKDCGEQILQEEDAFFFFWKKSKKIKKWAIEVVLGSITKQTNMA